MFKLNWAGMIPPFFWIIPEIAGQKMLQLVILELVKIKSLVIHLYNADGKPDRKQESYALNNWVSDSDVNERF